MITTSTYPDIQRYDDKVQKDNANNRIPVPIR